MTNDTKVHSFNDGFVIEATILGKRRVSTVYPFRPSPSDIATYEAALAMVFVNPLKLTLNPNKRK